MLSSSISTFEDVIVAVSEFVRLLLEAEGGLDDRLLVVLDLGLVGFLHIVHFLDYGVVLGLTAVPKVSQILQLLYS